MLFRSKGVRDRVRFEVVDITKPRSEALLAKTRGSTALPILEDETGRVLKESLVLLRYLEARFPTRRIAREDPYESAIESILIAQESAFTAAVGGSARRLVRSCVPSSTSASVIPACTVDVRVWGAHNACPARAAAMRVAESATSATSTAANPTETPKRCIGNASDGATGDAWR